MVQAVGHVSQRKSPQELQAKAFENMEKNRQLHEIKMAKSNTNFKNTRVTSGSAVLMKNGKNVCVGFPAPVDSRPKDQRANRSPETASMSQDTFKVRNNLHAGMIKKPLEPYHPNAHRSRLPSPTVIMPYKNSSQIVIGDRSSYYRKQFATTNGGTFVKPVAGVTSNPGI